MGFKKGHIKNIKAFKFPKGHKINVGKIPWNKNTHIQTNDALKIWRERGGINPNKGKKILYKSRPSMKGRIVWNKGKKTGFAPWLGKKRLNISGKKAYQWKGGITPENKKIRESSESKLWKKAVLERDNFTCQKTGERGGKLVAHHINNFADFPELRTSIENGITLSQKAHREFHKKYGYKNNTKKQLEEFLRA